MDLCKRCKKREIEGDFKNCSHCREMA